MIRAVLLALALAQAAQADTPLRPAEDWTMAPFPGLAVTGSLNPPAIFIGPPDNPTWSIDFWIPSFAVHPSPDGQHVLISPASGNLLGWSGDPDETVLWLYRAPGEEIANVPLRALIRPRAMERTTSHHVWITGYRWSENGWAFETPDGRAWHFGTDLTLSRR
ncbi:hypothetical protein [Hasllibacter sp. MH4015]|uniref:hypothetical protein n=1 Tax=Hasllibacter sp. MH4015 TaxID=2854029 RepID=UPI001CD5799E|nr:hypothetical protein [Hasllibacter sp. MH4015]